MDKKVYIRLKSRHWSNVNETIYLHEISQVLCEGCSEYEIKHLEIGKLRTENDALQVIDSMKVVSLIQQLEGNVDVQIIGPTQTVLYVNQKISRTKPVLFVFVWLLLFIGAGLAIMYFHEDVSMQKVHIKLHTIITGEEEEFPLWLQIPYSIGLGLGMILFFNHVFKGRINDEPTPLEMEMFNYEENIDKYISVYENDAWKKGKR
ncbi:stage V sporulation protein AA [Evansella sp. AB-rgal1]|uniref:stage V sporulation protein AA n=1 Tax=Evansella sp. AB-rgal1 TaxID=3242696 RepID=UPI00359D5F0D